MEEGNAVGVEQIEAGASSKTYRVIIRDLRSYQKNREFPERGSELRRAVHEEVREIVSPLEQRVDRLLRHLTIVEAGLKDPMWIIYMCVDGCDG